MAPNKTGTKPATSKKNTNARTQLPEHHVSEPSSDNTALTAVMRRLSQQFNLLAILIVALFLFQGYTFYRVKNLSTNGTVAGAAGGAEAQESPLTAEKMISYAKDLGMDTKKFEQCLTSGDKATIVAADTKQAADLGVQGTPGFFINGRFLGGAFPLEIFKEIIDKELDGTATGSCSDYSEGLQQYCSDPATAAFKPEAVEVAVNDAPARGPQDAAVTIVEFSDFECPFCHRAYTTIEQVLAEYPDDVRLVYKQFPLTNLHPNAQKAAEASLCAADQGKFWEYYDKLFQVQGAAAQ